MKDKQKKWIPAALIAAFFIPLTGAVAASPALNVPRIAVDRYGNDAEWYESRIPFFQSADPLLDEVYYYRWMLFRAHQRDLGVRGYITTEFLDDVSWQLEPWASLNDATGFHLGEGRWLRDRRYADDYVNHMHTGGNDRHFTDYMADSVWSRYLVDGDREAAIRHLAEMRRLFDAWSNHFDRAKGVYWTEPLLDATEYTISSIDASGGLDGFFGGNAFRPSINAYMFANARALANLYRLAGEPSVRVQALSEQAEAIRKRTLEALWNPEFEHFVDRYQVTNQHVRYWDFIRGRELVGYVPWAFDMVGNNKKYNAAWKHLLDADKFASSYGLRTVEPSYEHYMRQYRYDGGRYDGGLPECQWNGPIWPFQTTQVLIGMANLLDHHDQDVVARADYMRLLRQYARLHYNGRRLDLEEVYHPETGRPIVGLGRSHHYFHSGFVDLILTGVAGIRPRADNYLEVNPLLPGSNDAQALSWFRIQDVPYHGHQVAVTWDADGSRYGRKGITIEVDGREVARKSTLSRIVVPLPPRANPIAISRPINHAVQLRRDDFPKVTASTAADPENVHDAVDGRVWFMPELGNGWSSEPAPSDQSYEIDFGREVTLNRSELAFFADSGRFAVPRSYRIEAWNGFVWQKVGGTADKPLANGITNARWPALQTSKIRIAFTLMPNRAMRLVEAKFF